MRMVGDHERDCPSRWAVVVSIAENIACVQQTLHEWEEWPAPRGDPVSMLVHGGNPSDDLDLEIKTRKPVHSNGCPVCVRHLSEIPLPDRHYRLELVFRVRVERRDVHEIIERAACNGECSLEVIEGQLDLLFEIRFWRSIAATADLS